jgi:endo-beta-N-acetylglucosaminidase D
MNNTSSSLISCKPIFNLNDLLQWEPNQTTTNNIYPRKYRPVELNKKYFNLKDDVRRLVCHDMQNNYLDDKYLQGCIKQRRINDNNSSIDRFGFSSAFTFDYWCLIDIFIYFSHHFVTIPTEGWISAAHRNNVKCLGTFITEFDAGEQICSQFLTNSSQVDRVVDKLTAITLYYEFDGWLVSYLSFPKNKTNNNFQIK